MPARILAALTVLVFLAHPATAADPPKAKVTQPRTIGKPLQLFNGKNLDGWNYHSDDKTTPMEKVWSVKDGVLLCTGQPIGYIFTKRLDFENYLLDVEWRWPAAAGNSGVFIHYTEPPKSPPRGIEVQLASGDAGDFWAGEPAHIDIENAATRKAGPRIKNLTDGSEKPLGQWNAMQIICRAGEVTVLINGDLVNHGTHSADRKGAIALQSEGTPIEFRKVELRKLEQDKTHSPSGREPG
jgi:hypothetical protein